MGDEIIFFCHKCFYVVGKYRDDRDMGGGGKERWAACEWKGGWGWGGERKKILGKRQY